MKLNVLTQLRFILSPTPNALFSCAHPRFYVSPALSLIETSADKIETTANVLRRWGCTENDVSVIFSRHPSLRKMDVSNLESKLQILRNLGLSSSGLLKMIQCRPRFLNCRLSKDLGERVEYLQSLFGSKEVLLKALVRNPSLLNYELHDKMKLVIATFENIGVSKDDFIHMLLSRPTLIHRCILDDDKMEFIRRTGVSKDSKMYKYVVTIFSVSRIQTICEKVGNLVKFGLTEDEVLQLLGRNPIILTFSVDKIQRHITFISATMKLPVRAVLLNTCLLCYSLERVLKPRFFLGLKIDDMGLVPQMTGASMMTAFRMTEKRFIKVFISCHPRAVAEELMAFYDSVKCIKRLAESSKRHNGFPF